MESPAAGLHERIVMAVLIGLAVLTPIWIVLAHRAIAPTLLAMGFAVATRVEIWRAGVPYFLVRPDWSSPFLRSAAFFSAFCAWTSITGIWAPRADGPRLALDIFLPVLAGGAVIWEIARRPPEAASGFGRCFAYASAAAIILIAFEAATSGFLRSITPPTDMTANRAGDMTSLGRGATVVMVTLFAALLLLYRYRAPRLLLAGLAALAVFAAARFEIFSNVAGIMIGAMAFYASLRAPRKTVDALLALFLAALVLAPLAAFIPVDAANAEFAGRLPVSWLQRLAIWRNTGELIIGCLPFGCGADYARAVHALGLTVVVPGAPAPLPLMPIHPHNIFLQIWLEFGLPGAALFGAALYSGAKALKRAPLSALEKAAVAATVAGFLVSALVEASLWQLWRLSAPLFAGVFIAAARQRRLFTGAFGEDGGEAKPQASGGLDPS